MKVKVESEKVGLKLNIQKTKIIPQGVDCLLKEQSLSHGGDTCGAPRGQSLGNAGLVLE